MKKKWSHILMAGVMAVAMVATTACSKADKTDAPAADSAAASTAAEGSAVADAGDIGFPKNETITLVVPGKAGGGSDLGIRYYSEGLNRLYGLKTTVTPALNNQYITGHSEANPIKDFTLIACLQDNGFSTLAVPADAPYDDFAGFVDYAKAHPGELNAGMPAA